MEGSRRSFDRSREPGVKRARLSDEPNLRDPRILNSGVRSIRAPPADVLPSRYRQIEREAEANDGGGYHPTHQLFSELVSEYRKGLAELTINSKPIITNLTIIAGENLHAAKSIAEAICNHIIEVPSEQKLPSLYLLDSIVKNIGRDYIKYFSTKLPEVFCKAYKQADPSIHTGLRHLFRTWEGVFPLQPLQIIEKELGISLAVNGSGSVSTRSKPEPQSQYPQKSIHVNPKYLEARQKLQPPSRVKGLTTDTSSNVMKSTGNVGRLSIQHREPVRESMYEKDAEVLFDDYDYSMKKSGIGQHDKHWYGTGTNPADTVMGQRNGYDGKRKVTSYSTPQSVPSRTNGGMSRSWKNNEEEEYLWDDIDSRVNKHSTPADPRKDNMAFDNCEDMESTDGVDYPVATTLQSIQSADYARVLGVTSAGTSSSLGRKALHPPQMIRSPVVGALAKSQTNNRSTIGQKRPAPAPPSRQPTLYQRSPSPSFSAEYGNSALNSHTELDHMVSQSAQRAVSKSPQITERDNIRPRGQLKGDSSPVLQQKSKLIPSSVPPSHQRMQQHSLAENYMSELKLSEPVAEAPTVKTSAAEAVQQLSQSDLLAAVLNSGVLSKGPSNPKPELDSEDHSGIHPPVTSGLARRQEGSKALKMSSATTSAQDNKPGSSVSRRVGTLSQTTTSKAGEEKKATANPYSNLLSTLMEKGLITSSKNESSPTPIPSDESEGAIPGVISKLSRSTLVPDSSSHSSLSGGDDLSASKHVALKDIDNPSKAPQVKNLIGFEFKPSLMRQLHDPVIEDLIDGLPYRCNICGLRLKIQERLDRHMEWHSSKEFDNEYGASRRWFSDSDDWVAGNFLTAVEPVESAEETEEATIEDELCLVPADERQCVCILCGELFEDYYSHEEDEWMFRGAMHVKISGCGYENIITNNGDIKVHVECFTESTAAELGLVAKVKVEEDS
ncbi:unnamed protein product [Rhodiola kirilowii]